MRPGRRRVAGAPAPRVGRARVAVVVALLAVSACSDGTGPLGSSGTASDRTAPTGATTTGTASTGTASTGTATSDTTPSGTSPTSGGKDQGIHGQPPAAGLAQARQDVSDLSTRELAGQLVVGVHDGTAAENAAAVVSRHGLGGVITFGHNVPEDPAARAPALQSMSDAVADAVADSGRDWPALVGVDQEGGPVTRVGSPVTPFPSAMALGAAGDPELAQRVAAASGQELRALGYTTVFAPVADVTLGPQDPTIGVRSPGSDPELVAKISTAMTRGYLEAGIIPVPKHFPGHGSVTTDSHVGLPVQSATVTELSERDLVPFAQLADRDAPAMMVAHIVLADVDPDLPATLSPAVTTGLLREDLGFEGLVVTDAMNMAAIADTHGSGPAAVRAVRAGVDVVLMPADVAAAIDGLVGAVETGDLSRERLEEAATRMVATLRHVTGPPSVDDPGPGVLGSHADTARELADAAITQLTGSCGERLVGEAVTVQGGTALDRARFTDAAQEAGLATGYGDTVVLLGGAAYRAGGGGNGGSGSGTGDVVVALDVPYGLDASAAGTAKLAAFGRTPPTFDALVAVLTGEQQAVGSLPVGVGEHDIGAGCG